MLYYLHNFSEFFGPLRLFEYITFRAGGAFFTAFLLTVFAIPLLLPFYQKHCIQKSSRTDDGKKPYKPLMGGVIIIGAVVVSALLWGMISDRKLVVFILATLALATLGFVDDFIKLKYLRQERDGVKRNTKIIVQAIISVVAIYALYKTQGTVTMKIFLPCFKQAFQFVPGSENISVMTPFSSEAWFTMPLYIMPLCLIFMLLLNFGVLFCASNGVNLTDGKDGLASGCMIFASLAFAVISYLSGHKIFAEYLLNLRENNSDQDKIAAINKRWDNAITLYEIPLDTGSITEDDLYKILTVIRDAPKPLLIHCWHGSDRTGCSVAAYRIVFENWSVEDAISELMKPEYGHHKNIYTNIPELLRKADWKKIKMTILDKEK